MRIVYSPDCSCDLIERGFAHPNLRITYVRTAQEASEALAVVKREWANDVERYHSVHGPGGHVLAVRP